MILNDPYLENYIYSLISKIAPIDIVDGRPGNVNILIVDNPTLNAGMYSNGTMVIHTGLLSALHSEDELVAILSHEIAHFVLDHSVQNVNKATARKKRAEFWAALATGLTAAAEGVAASKGHYYAPGAATLGMAVLSTTIASQIVERLGMNYNAEQEEEADNIAIKVLEILEYDKNALATALNRMQENMVKERSNMMYFQSFTHPALVDRIRKTGTPQNVIKPEYEKEISFAITSSARLKFEDRRFRQTLPLVETNIKNGVATAEDYILKANCLLALFNDNKSNNEVLSLISKAKAMDESNINHYKAEILGNLRLRKFDVAQQLLQSYISTLNELEMQLKDIESDITWDTNYKFVISERDWANRMLIKVKVMQ
jgi:predicted Zn-dependent protease